MLHVISLKVTAFIISTEHFQVDLDESEHMEAKKWDNGYNLEIHQLAHKSLASTIFVSLLNG